jgi:hypothetical protein
MGFPPETREKTLILHAISMQRTPENNGDHLPGSAPVNRAGNAVRSLMTAFRPVKNPLEPEQKGP